MTSIYTTSAAAVMNLTKRIDHGIDTPLSVTLFVVGLIFSITSILSVAGRVAAKRINKTKLSIEDYLCFSGLALVILQYICINLEISMAGEGHDKPDVTSDDRKVGFQLLIAYQVLYCLAVATVKCSIVFFYIRIFGVTKTYRVFAYCLVAFISAWAIMSILIAFLSCHPFAFTYDPTIPGGYCDAETSSFVAEAILDLVADIAVFVMPLRPISKLHITKEKKIGLLLVFTLGISTMIMAVLRIVTLAEQNFEQTFQLTSAPPMVYSFLEPAIGISVASIPLLQPLIKTTWLGKKLQNRSVSGSRRRTFMPSNGVRKFNNEEDNEMRLFEANSVSISAGKGTSDFDEGDSYPSDSAHAITKTERVTISRELS